MGSGRVRFALALGLGLTGATSAHAGCQLQQLAQLPVTIEDGGAIVPAKLNGSDARLTVDTGAFFSMLNPAAILKYSLKTGPLPAYLTVSGVTGAADIRLTTVKDVAVLGVPMHNVDFLVGEHAVSVGDGLLGQNLLAVLDTEFDFAGGAIRLMKPVGCGQAALAYWDRGDDHYGAMSIEPIERPDMSIRGYITINGYRLRAQFDTGATRSVLSVDAARRAGVRTTDPGVIDGGAWGGIGRGVAKTWIAPFNLVDIGGEQVKNTRLRIAQVDLADADMLIGADFFLSHRIYVSKSQRKLYFTYNGGPVFNLDVDTPSAAAPATASPAASAGQASALADPSDAAGFAHRGATDLARGLTAQAVADFGRAAALEPTNPQPLYDRARAQLDLGQRDLALADLDRALKLRPDDANALVLRGRVRLESGDTDRATADFDAALKQDPSLRLEVAAAYSGAGRFEQSLAHLDQWIASHPRDADLAEPLNGRCWTRALWGHDLDKALADCNQALRLWPGAPSVLDSRGLVFLRTGQLDKAISDYTAALKLEPHLAWSLYGRGLARLRQGQKIAGDADVAAARAIRPKIAEEAAKYGVN